MAALREVVEETGFDLKTTPVRSDHEMEFKSRFGDPVKETTFCLSIPGLAGSEPVPRLDAREHTAFEWVSFKQAMALLPYPGQKAGLQKSAQKITILNKKV